MAYVTIIAVVEVPDLDVPPMESNPDGMLELGMGLFKNQETLRFITAVRDVTAVAMMEGADPSLWPVGIEVGSF